MPTTTCLPAARRRTAGPVTTYRFGTVIVLIEHRTPEVPCLVAVGIVGEGNKLCMSTVWDRRPIMILRAKWEGPLPRAGEYLMATKRARGAYVIVAEPRIAKQGQDQVATLDIRVERVDLPIPVHSIVHPWRWDTRGKNTGAGTRGV